MDIMDIMDTGVNEWWIESMVDIMDTGVNGGYNGYGSEWWI